MKIRTGFVSNSSSSSFIVYGFMCEYDDELYGKLKDTCDFDNPHWEYITDMEDEGYIIGKTLVDIENGWDYIDPIDKSKLDEYKEEVVNNFKKDNIDISDKNFRLILGYHYS